MGRKKGVKNKPQMTGIGDVVKAFTQSLGIKQCEGCSRRQKFLNKAFPFNKIKGEMTQQQFEDWGAYRVADKKIILDSDMDFIEDTYNAINITSLEPCRSCGGEGWLQLIKGIEKVYAKY